MLLTTAGDHVPVIPLFDVNGSTGATEPSHIAAIGLNVGVTFGVTVTSNVVGIAHLPAVGVKVYVPLAVLLTTAGDQVPVMPLLDIAGNAGATEFKHSGPMAVNTGVICASMVMFNVAVVAH